MNGVLKDRNVLIVDDDERNRFALSSYLDSYEMHITVAKNGREAIDILKNGDKIDVILLDIMMPILDGFETLKILRSDDSFKKIPVIAVTAKAMKGDKEKCLEAGAWEYIPKPIDLKAFINRLEKYFPDPDA
jgi:CheY-like chemotaxis protein